MLSAPLRYCTGSPTCRAKVRAGLCEDCRRQRERWRGTAASRGYDSRWAKASKAFRNRFPVCGMKADGTMDTVNSWCARDGLASPAECVQHIEPFDPSRGQADPRFWNQGNWMSSCQRCNNRRRALEPGSFGRLRPAEKVNAGRFPNLSGGSDARK